MTQVDPAAVPVAGVEMAVWVAETMAVLAAAPPGAEPQGRLLDPAVVPVAGAEHYQTISLITYLIIRGYLITRY